MLNRKIKQKAFNTVCFVSALITASLFLIILGFIFLNGLPSLNLKFLITEEFTKEGAHQGILNAIVGTVILSVSSVILAAPLSVAVAIYLSEYSKENALTKTLRFLIDVLSGMPAIVLGALGFIFLVAYLKFFSGGFSLIAGTITLAVLVFPTIERVAEEALRRTPQNLKEASYAMGSTKWQVIKTIVVPCSLPGIITGIVLGIGRAAEESAVIVLTAGYSQYIPTFETYARDGLFLNTKFGPFQKEIGSLPIAVYNSYSNPFGVPFSYGFAIAFVLIVVVLIINLSAKYISGKYSLEQR